jgi:hypothetical protein
MNLNVEADAGFGKSSLQAGNTGFGWVKRPDLAASAVMRREDEAGGGEAWGGGRSKQVTEFA